MNVSSSRGVKSSKLILHADRVANCLILLLKPTAELQMFSILKVTMVSQGHPIIH